MFVGVTAHRLLQDRYQTEELLGRGGMAAVWRGRDLRLDRPVAIKELTGEGPGNATALERFEREARAVARLSHPNVVSVYDYGVQDGTPFLVMELVNGPTVATMLEGGPLPLADALAIASQTCDGLAVAHSAGIIHRDIKPANLILAPAGVVKICDFGVVRLLDTAGQASLTAPAEAMGSPMYMAPEQITGDRLDPRTDLYALGCTMYAMLAGYPPFNSGDPLSIVHQHVYEAPEPLRLRRPDLPPEVEALVSELLAKTPDQRPSDAAAVHSRVASIMQRLTPEVASSTVRMSAVPAALAPSATPPDPAPIDKLTAYPVARRRWRRPTAMAAMAATLLAAIVLALLTLRPADDTTADPPGPATSPTAATATASLNTSPSPSSRSAAPTTTGPTAGRSPTAQRTPTAPPPPTDPIVALRLAIQQQVNSGHLNADTARDLNHMVDDLAKAIANDNPDDEAKKLKALRDKLTSLYKEGKLSADGYRTLNRNLDRISAALG
jgi:eukaryotic-like serine/threonine-protein kinase